MNVNLAREVFVQNKYVRFALVLSPCHGVEPLPSRSYTAPLSCCSDPFGCF
jgi:hypothetical protein